MIQDAVDAASSGDIIIVGVGKYNGDTNINTANLHIQGNDSVECKVTHYHDGANWLSDFAAVFNITASGVNITGFNITSQGSHVTGICLTSAIASGANIYGNNFNCSPADWGSGVRINDYDQVKIYNNNFDVQSPGFPVRDGSEPYTIDASSASAQWYPWKFQHPFTDYRIDKGLVWMAWTEVGGDVEQYIRWYAPGPSPHTRIFSPPSTAVNPAVGQLGQYCYYWTRFEFKRMRSLAVTKFYRMTPSPGGSTGIVDRLATGVLFSFP